MKNSIFILLLTSIVFANSSGPNAGHANNAPSLNNCTSCHSGTANTGDGSVVFTGLPESYVPGTTYEVTITVDGTGGSGYGFQAIAQAGNTPAGSILLNPNSSQAEMNGDFIQQSAPTTSGSWVFDWIAPSSDVGDVTFSASGLAANYPSSNAGDEVYTSAVVIPALVPADVNQLFYSEYAEGGGQNKYLEIFNSSDEDVNLSDYQYLNCGNACDDWEYTNSFADGAVIAAGGVYTICHPEFEGDVEDVLCDERTTIYHNGNDPQALYHIESESVVDVIGYQWTDNDPVGFTVGGIENATANHTLVRKSSIVNGNNDWASSAGTNLDNSEWVVLDNETWDYLGSHPHEFAPPEVSLLITTPQNNSIINDDGLSIEFTVSNFTVGSVGDVADGHLHYSLDDADPIMHYSVDPIVLDNLVEGDHSFRLWLVDSEHASLDPSVEVTVNFTTSSEVSITSIYDIQYVADPETDDASPLEGQDVTIQGIVTAEFWGSGDRKYMTVQDANGPWSGILCYEADGWDDFSWTDEFGSSISGPGEGDAVTLTGTVNEYYNFTQLLDVSSGIVHPTSDGDLVILPLEILAGDVGESYESCLIELTGAMVSELPNDYGEWKFSTIDINGGGTVMCDDKWDYFYFPILDQELSSVIGVLDYSFGNYKLQPRLARDVVEQGPLNYFENTPVSSSGVTRFQRIQQVLHSDLMKAGVDYMSDMSYMINDTVDVRGVVTMPNGLSYAGTGDKFIISDLNGGPWSSILVYAAGSEDPDEEPFPTLYEGDLIQFRAKVIEFSTDNSNMTELEVIGLIDIVNVAQDLPTVSIVNTGDLRWPTEAEQWGNVMVKVEDAIVEANEFQYDVMEINDGSGSVLVDDDSDSLQAYYDITGPPPVGSYIQSMEGWVYHHYGSYTDSTAYKLCPLYPEDIVFGAGPPTIASANRVPCAPLSNEDEVIVSCTIEDNSTITEALVYYSLDGSTTYASVVMTQGEGSQYSGAIPVTGASSVFYYISATDDGEGQSEPKTSTLPYGFENEQFGFYLTDQLTINMVQENPWASDRSLYENCSVTLSGIVTSNADEYAYALQSESAQWSGILFDTSLVDIARGQEATITGTVVEHYGATALSESQVTAGDVVGEPEFLNVSCEDLSIATGEDTEIESYEGVLVKLMNVTVTSVGSYDWTITDDTGFEILIDDDFSNLEADVFLDALVVGQEITSVSGVFNYSYGDYKVQIRDLNDVGELLGVNDDVQVNPYTYSLSNNYPNPFNPETQIRFSIGNKENVKLIVYDMMGRQVSTLINGESFNPGFHAISWRGLDNLGNKVPSGVYIYRVVAGDYIADKKMILLK